MLSRESALTRAAGRTHVQNRPTRYRNCEGWVPYAMVQASGLLTSQYKELQERDYRNHPTYPLACGAHLLQYAARVE